MDRCLLTPLCSTSAPLKGYGIRRDSGRFVPVQHYSSSFFSGECTRGLEESYNSSRLYWKLGRQRQRRATGGNGRGSSCWTVVTSSCGVEGKRTGNAVIIGAGPAGAMLALLLARQNWKVDVYECKQWRDGYWAPEQPDGWSVMLGARAAHCLDKVGLKEDVWAQGVLCTGRTTITGRGLTPKYEAYGYDMLAISQPKLASVLINSGLTNYPEQISYHFGWTLQALDPDESRAEFRPSIHSGSHDELVSVTAELLVGADGLHSKTRGELETKIPAFKSTLHSVPAGRHIRIRVPMDVAGTQVDEEGKTHGPSMLVVARNSKLLWGIPNSDGSMGLTLQGIKGSTATDVSKEMSESFPELATLFEDGGEASAHLAAAQERLQGSVTTTSYNHKQVVLLGDAAHSLLNVTHLGTGLALEDCLVLDQLLRQSLTSTESNENPVAKHVADALTLFSSQRVPEMVAAAKLCFDVSKTNMFQVELQRAILKVITKVLPRLQPWQKTANTQVVSVQQLVKWRARETWMVRVILVFTLLLMLLRAVRLVRLAQKALNMLVGGT